MAVRTRGGGPGMAAALVVFVILFFLALIFAVVYYVQARGMQQKYAQAQRDLQQVIRSDEKSQLASLASGGKTIVGALLEQRNWALATISGDPEAEFQTVQDQVTQAGLRPGNAMLTELQDLRQQLAMTGMALQQQAQQLLTTEAQVSQTQEEKGTQQGVFDQSVTELQGELNKQQSDLGQYRQEVTDKLGTLTDAIAENQRRHRETLDQLDQEMSRLRTENAVLKSRIEELTPSAGPDGPVVDPSLLPDGQVLTIEPNGRWLYINRGRNHHIVLGMTFEVFDDAASIVGGAARGKASIKVVEVLDDSAKCLVTRTSPGKTINEDDVIANAVYSPDATFNFFVYGDFDIENTGTPKPSDLRRIEEMITGWGGRVGSELTYDTDFVVLGKQPPKPVPVANEIDPVQIAKAVRQRQIYDQYQELVEKATKLSVPILNQNRFLVLVGHYER